MSYQDWNKIQQIFEAASALSGAERSEYLNEICGDNTDLRREVESLLAHDAEAGSKFMAAEFAADGRQAAEVADASNATLDAVAAKLPPRRPLGPPTDLIDGYEILKEIHRGGQGIVYQALQKTTKRKVAIKVLLEGPYASENARRRFEREIELVAQLKHPNIVEVFHSGVTSDGRQFCVMDYFRGVPLDDFVRGKKLTLDEALKLFVQVCSAVNYAHQKGVIHRDLKPSNILVNSNGHAEVLDFGLAKAIGISGERPVSLTGQVIGTLPYMSPEQARGNPDEIDIRTDVYALGVILYELLTGTYPYPVVGQVAEVLRHIADTNPTPPSSLWKPESGILGNKRPSRSALRASSCPIDDEVETIVLRSLAKEPERRYQSAGALGADVAHYLSGEAIEAKKDSGFYLLKKSLVRHRQAVSLIGALVLVISIGLTAIVWLGAQSRAERRQREAIELVRTAENFIAQRRNLQEAEDLLSSVIEMGVFEGEALFQRGRARAIRALDAPISEKRIGADEAIKDLNNANIAKGGRSFSEIITSDAIRDSKSIGGMPNALRMAADIRLLNQRHTNNSETIDVAEQAYKLFLEAGQIENAGRDNAAIVGQAPNDIYFLDRDSLRMNPPGASPEDDRIAVDYEQSLTWILKSKVKEIHPFNFNAPPRMQYIAELIFDDFFVLGSDGRCSLNTSIAELKESSGNSEVYSIRPGITWHDGYPLSAEDVIFSWELSRLPNDCDAPTTSGREDLCVSSVMSLARHGESSIRVNFRPNAGSDRWELNFPLLPKHQLNGDGNVRCKREIIQNIAEKPTGTGPFRFADGIGEEDKEYIRLARFEDRPIGKALISNIVFRVIEDQGERLNLLSGDKPVVAELSQNEFRWHVNGEDFQREIYKVIDEKLQYDYICWNLKSGNFDFTDIRVRRALTHAIDLDYIRQVLFSDLYTSCHGIFQGHPFSTFGEHEQFPFNPEEAKQLLDDAGWRIVNSKSNVRVKGDQHFAFELMIPQGYPSVWLAALMCRDYWGRVGIEVKIVEAHWGSEFKPRMKSGDFDALLSSVICNADPIQDRVRWCTNQEKNHGGYSNELVDTLFQRICEGLPPDQSGRVYQQIQREIYDDQPYLFLWQKPTMWAFSKQVRGVQLGSFGPVLFHPGPRSWWIARR